MSERSYSDAELEAAVEALSEEGALADAEALVAAAAPQLQLILARALESGGWFAELGGEELRKALEFEEPERTSVLRTLIAEESRTGMMVGVAVGWALAQRLRAGGEPPAS